jgi:hypothetical protein
MSGIPGRTVTDPLVLGESQQAGFPRPGTETMFPLPDPLAGPVRYSRPESETGSGGVCPDFAGVPVVSVSPGRPKLINFANLAL